MPYPGSLDSYTTKVDLTDLIRASHINDLQSAVVAIETELGIDPAGGYATVKARLADFWANVKDSGAVGDGSTNDRAAINTAQTSLTNGGWLFFPAGTYKISSAITLGSNTIGLLFAPGAKLSVDVSVTVTVAGMIVAGEWQVFSGSGTVSFSKKQRVYPEWWGAVGDGTTDDTAAIQKAIDAASREVLFGERTYLISVNNANTGALILRTGTSLIGVSRQTSIIKLAADSTGRMAQAYEVNNVQVRNLQWDGNEAANTSASQSANVHGLFIQTVNDLLIENCYFKSIPRFAIYSRVGGSKQRFLNNIIEDLGDHLNRTLSAWGISVTATRTTPGFSSGSFTDMTDVIIKGNIIKGTGSGATYNYLTDNCRGINVSGDRITVEGNQIYHLSTSTVAASGLYIYGIYAETSRNLVIANNLLEDIKDTNTTDADSGTQIGFAIAIGSNIALGKCYDIAITNNVMRNTVAGIGPFFVENLTIQGNTVVGDANSKGSGIELNSFTSLGLPANNNNNVVISGNNFDNIPTHGIFISNVYGFTVVGNKLRNIKKHGINLPAETGEEIKYGIISDNLIESASTLTNNLYDAFVVGYVSAAGTASGIMVRGLKILGLQANKHRYGIFLRESAIGVSVKDCVVENSQTAAFLNSGSGNYIIEYPEDILTAVASISSTTTLTLTHNIVLVDASLGAVTINLPSAVGITGKMYTIKKIDSSVNAVTVDPNGVQTIDTETTLDLPSQWLFLRIVSDGSNWTVL